MDFDSHEDYFLNEYDDENKNDSSSNRRIIDFENPDDDDHRRQTGKSRRHRSRFMTKIVIVCVIAIGVYIYFHYFNPYIADARISGYITTVEKRGLLFKTYEGEMISETPVADSHDVYRRDFTFSITDEKLARQLQSLEGTGKKVTIVYEKYNGALPWRGSTPYIAVALLP
ncbi:MAG: hypothetical protein J1E38_00975 [Paramuribaculum sp.]|nr:hypothetical protein [Paramuribaculum sp.]